MSTLPLVDVPLRLVVRQDEGVPVLVVPAELHFDRLREWVRARMGEVLAELGGRACRLDLGEREIQLFDVRRLLHLLRDEFQVEVTGLYVRTEAVHRYAERELKLKLFLSDAGEALPEVFEDVEEDLPAVLPGLGAALEALTEDEEASPPPAPEAPAEDDDDAAPATFTAALRRPVPLPEIPREEPAVDESGGRRVLTITRTLRSGSALHYEGDVHVYGDVNAGAQVRAGGSIVVFGRLRGVVHAGAQGDESAFVLAFDMAPTQVRVGRQIAITPSRPPSEAFAPEIATVQDGAIVLEPWRGRIPSASKRPL